MRLQWILCSLGLLALTACDNPIIENIMAEKSIRDRQNPRAVQADLRTLATGLESYYIDNNAYPAWSAEPMLTGISAEAASMLPALPAFRIKQNTDDRIHTLTTPIAYLVQIPSDPYSPTLQSPNSLVLSPYCYWTPEDGQGWIVWSAGPDGDYDIKLDNVTTLYQSGQTGPSASLLAKTYDPANGAESDGDIWRIKE